MTSAHKNWLPKRLGALCAVLLIASAPGWGGELPYRFHRQFSEDSLLIASVRDFTQDPQGFLWFIQRRTLHRYDGTEITTVAKLKSDNDFSVVASDAEGNIWLGTTNGLQVWDRETQRLEPWTVSQGTSFFRTRVVSLALDATGSIWAASSGGRVARIGAGAAEPEFFSAADIDPANLQPMRLSSLIAGPVGTIWIGSLEGKLFRHTPGEAGFEAVELGSERSIQVLAPSGQTHIWIGTTDRELLRVDAESLTVEALSIETAAPITSLAEDPQGHLWVGTELGIKILQPGGLELESVHTNPESPGEPSTDGIRALYLDRGSVIWIGAGEGGVSTTSTGASAFSHWQPQGKGPTVPITSITETRDGSLWVGTFKTGLFRRMPSGEVKRYGRNLGDEPDLGDTTAMSLLEDSQNMLWIGTMRQGLSVLDLESEEFRHYVQDASEPTSLNSGAVLTLFERVDGKLLIGTFSGGLNVLDRDTETFQAFTHDPADPTSLSENQVRSALEDSTGRLWVGTRNHGLNLQLPGEAGFVRFRHDPDDPTSLASDTVMAITEDSRGDLWLGTYMGLQRVVVEREDVSFETFGPAQGLGGPRVLSILEDRDGYLWLSTGQGISRFDLGTRTFTNLERNHGLPPVGYNYNAYTQTLDGSIHYGSNHGVTSFDPSAVSLETYTPQIVLTGVQRLNQDLALPGKSAQSGNLTFSHRDRLLSFEFSLLDFNDSERNRYEHFLEGFDDDWIDVGSLPRASYSNLPPGNYTFRVRGANSEGVWSAEDATLPIRILPPPWATWWAYTLYVLSLGALVMAYVRHQARKQRQEARYTQRLEREVHRRTRELAEQNEKLRYANELLEVASVTDSLTGVRNRRFLLTTINQDIALVERSLAVDGDEARQDSAFVFILFDLDGFKEINDTYGHSAGDLVLFQVRDLLNQACRSSDTLIRWGGDEFLIVAREATRAHVEALAERIRQSVADHLFDIGTSHPVQLTCSLGFACYPFVASNHRLYTWEEVVDIADRALYVAKRHGPNMWAGIFGTDQTEETPPEDLLVMIMERPELLGAEGSIRLVTSRPTPTQAELHSTSGSQRAS